MSETITSVRPSVLDQLKGALAQQKHAEGAAHATARFYELLLGGDMAGVQGLLDDGIVLEIRGPAGMVFTGRTEGKAAVLGRLAENFGRAEYQHVTLKKMISTEAEVVLVFEEDGKLKGDQHVAYTIQAIQIWTQNEGKITSIYEIIDDPTHLMVR